MKTLKKIINRYMYRITAVLVLLIMIIVLFIEVIREQRRAHQAAVDTFGLIEQILEENQRELDVIREEYKQTSLNNVEIVARIVENDPEVMNDHQELRKLAASLEVDEIHIFDETGHIIAGTNPEYYNVTFKSGEQISFFKILLTDKSLKLVQEIMPNTVAGKFIQYSACWNASGDFIVQVGMEPVNINKLTEKNKISYIFSTFGVGDVSTFYAINATSGEIVGASNAEHIGDDLTKVGFDFSKVKGDSDGFHQVINGELSFCIFCKMGDNYVGRVIPADNLYERVPISMLVLCICLATVAFILAYAVTKHMNKYVVDEIYTVNAKLNSITNGNLEEKVDVQSSVEMFALGEYINRMVKSMMDNNKKMSYVLSKTDLYIGIYEYNEKVNRVRYTEYIPKIFSIEPEEMEKISKDITGFKALIEEIRKNPESGEQGVYKYGDKYIRVEEIVDGREVFGVAIDLTVNIVKLKEAKNERDKDSLTGLYNRRGFNTKMSQLFEKPEELGCSAVIMIDADELKRINDTYGHEKGDIYLKKIAAIINNFGIKGSMASRIGGDEFVLFLYEYDGEEELIKTIETLRYIQNNSSAKLSENVVVPLKFSMGYTIINGECDYKQMLKEADEKMYKDKEARRKRRDVSE